MTIKEIVENVGAYFKRDAVAVDDAANVFLGGHPDETISARSERDAENGNPLAEGIVDVLDTIQTNHGVLAEEHDLKRAEAVVEIEKKALGKKENPHFL